MRCTVISFALKLITFVIFAVVSAAGIMGASPPVSADDRAVQDGAGREAVLGTFHIRPKPAEDERWRIPNDGSNDDQGSPPHDGLISEFSDLSTKHLLHVFADAHEALQSGDRNRAQHLYERVIAASPNSRLADAARKELAALYRDHDRQKKEVARDKRGKHDRVDQQDRSIRYGDAVYGPQQPTATRKARITIEDLRPARQRSRRVVMLERQFIAEVGDRVFFAPGSAELGVRARDVLAQQAAWLEVHPDLVVTIEGHADDGVGRKNAHYELALTRAEAVRRGLMHAGVRAARITTKSFGRQQPVAQCESSQCAAQNRRVVTVISDGPVRTARETVPVPGRGVSEPIDAASPPRQFERSGRRPVRAFR